LVAARFSLTWGVHVYSIAIAFIAGSCFYDLPETSSGAFTRGGVLFIAMLFNALNAFSELPTQMQGRPIMYKQVQYRFYRPGALSIAQTLADLPMNALKIMIFDIIIYFLSGLARTAGAFFTNYLFIFRVLGTATRDYNVAARLAALLISIMVIYAGYMIPVFTMKRWLFWLYYLNPLSYGFESLMINEFKRVNLYCDTSYVVPHNLPGVVTGLSDAIANTAQVCTLQGATPGQAYVPGRDYAYAGYRYSVGHQWRNFGILIAFFIFFAVLQIIAMEVLALKAANVQSIVVFAKENKDTKERNARLQDRKAAVQAGEVKQDLEGLIDSKRPFTWDG
jgi:ATP-binding cassette subfamily G (WHITE) protein 2 (SNQ2)